MAITENLTELTYDVFLQTKEGAQFVIFKDFSQLHLHLSELGDFSLTFVNKNRLGKRFANDEVPMSSVEAFERVHNPSSLKAFVEVLEGIINKTNELTEKIITENSEDEQSKLNF